MPGETTCFAAMRMARSPERLPSRAARACDCGPRTSATVARVQHYTARALLVSIYTEADTMESLREAVRDAVKCRFDEENRPRAIRLHRTRGEVMPA